jgi:hypothetical protein
LTIDIITFRGTGEDREYGGATQGMLKNISDRVLPRSDSFNFYEPDWEAHVGPAGGDPYGHSLATCVAAGVAKGAEACAAAENPVALMGYSLGGIVASELLEGIENGTYTNFDGSPIEVAFMLNISNPLRRRGEAVGYQIRPDLFGLHGERAESDAPVFEIVNPNDCITATAGNSPLRIVNDAITPFSFVEGWKLGDVNAAIQRMKDLEVGQNWWDAAWWQKYSDAFRGAVGYALPFPWGDHVSYSIAKVPGSSLTYTQYAADLILENFS